MSQKNFLKPPHIIALKEAQGHDRFDDLYEEFRPDAVHFLSKKENNLFLFETENGITLELRFLTNNVTRFRYTHRAAFERDFSYSLNPRFSADISLKIALSETEDFYLFEKNNGEKIRIQKVNFALQVIDNQDNIIFDTHTEGGGFYAKSTIVKGTTEVRMSAKTDTEEQFFGLGDKGCALNLQGEKTENWCTDAFGFGPQTKAIYRAIPFVFSSKNYGIFFDNTFRSHFDFNSEKNNLFSFSAEGGEMNFYLITADTQQAIVQTYTHLTGTPEMPPIWALGFHQCRWSYFPESRVLQVGAEFRKRQIPCDALYLDIDYMDGFRCFTWNKNLFPNPKKLISDLENAGFHTVVMIDPGIKVDKNYKVYTEGVEKKYFVKRNNGELMIGYVWPGATVFPDYTDPRVRRWWGDLYKELYVENGVSGFWNDMNEPACFKLNAHTIPEDTLHYGDGELANHARIHNVYGMLMSQSSYEGFKRLRPAKRPFLVTRASFSGGQRYAAVWTGDNFATWEHLEMANRQIQRLAMSGYSFAGTDIGGFAGTPTGELMVRWTQLAVFHPFMRIHSMGNHESGNSITDEERVKANEAADRHDREPWAYGKKYNAPMKQAIEKRYRLLPYIYSSFYEYVNTGKSIAWATENERDFYFGNDLFVSPIVAKGTKKQTVVLPKDYTFDFETGKTVETEKETSFETPLSTMLIFARKNSVLPIYPVLQNTRERATLKQITYRIFAEKGEGTSKIYEDSGEGYGYQVGEYRLATLNVKTDNDAITVTQTVEGSYRTPYTKLQFALAVNDFEVKSIEIDGKKVTFSKKENFYIFYGDVDFKTIKVS